MKRRHEFDFDPAFWFRSWGKGRGGRRRRGAWFGSGDMKYVILKLLRERPMHGYEIMKELEEKTRGCYKPSPGTVYPTLQWLEDGDLVEMEVVKGKKVYSITDDGRQFLEDNSTTVEDIFDRVGEMIDRIFQDPGPDVSRAIGRLVGVAYRGAWRDGTSSGKEEIVNIIDEATSRVEDLLNERGAAKSANAGGKDSGGQPD
jgi:DNA-binding PadR family transcriptional regulator